VSRLLGFLFLSFVPFIIRQLSICCCGTARHLSGHLPVIRDMVTLGCYEQPICRKQSVLHYVQLRLQTSIPQRSNSNCFTPKCNLQFIDVANHIPRPRPRLGASSNRKSCCQKPYRFIAASTLSRSLFLPQGELPAATSSIIVPTLSVSLGLKKRVDLWVI
jgi:hypothetical protein